MKQSRAFVRVYDDILVPLDPLACALEPGGTRVERARVAQYERLVAGRAARGIHRAGQDIASSVHDIKDKKALEMPPLFFTTSHQLTGLVGSTGYRTQSGIVIPVP